jgi:hypothetical protein
MLEYANTAAAIEREDGSVHVVTTTEGRELLSLAGVPAAPTAPAATPAAA